VGASFLLVWVLSLPTGDSCQCASYREHAAGESDQQIECHWKSYVPRVGEWVIALLGHSQLSDYVTLSLIIG
jgi:hypothetical protein